MHGDAENRLDHFINKMEVRESITKRIRKMMDAIKIARARGATWDELSEVLGVSRDTLASTVSRILRNQAKSSASRKPPDSQQQLRPERPRKGVQPWADGS